MYELDSVSEPTDYEELDAVPVYQPQELQSLLLSFGGSELAHDGQTPEDALIQKAAELHHWQLSGQRPRYVINHWVEVVLTGNLKGFCRILNSRTHQPLDPLTLSELLHQVDTLTATVNSWRTHADFVPRLLAAYDELDAGGPVHLEDLHREMAVRQPDYRREHFGFDLAELYGCDSLEGRSLLLGLRQPRQPGRFSLPALHGMPAAEADQITLGPTLQSLDI
ncbi:MAG: hypothetical protein ACO1RX_08930 [Candidatus Sericytochromatia bacterium]